MLGIIFDKSNTVVFDRIGNKNSIVFSSEELSSRSTLSEADVNLAINHKLKEIVAFGSKGVFYRLRIKNNAVEREAMVQYRKSQSEVSSILYNVYKNGHLTKKQIDLEIQHLTMVHFAKNSKGIKYEISN